jgi:signal transduction histidine kinase
VRRRLERVANRLVFGRRATPYEVLSEFSRRVAATSNDLLDDAARSLAEGTRAERVVISVMVDGEALEAAAWPEGTAASAEPVSFPITDADTTLGSLDVYLPAGQQLQDDDRRLAEQLASGMGLALRNQLLTERLEARVEELRESRRRLVAVQDETRRRLERDLHDGAQQQLVALKVKLGLGRAIAEKDGASQTAELLSRLSGEADAAVDAMREFARGVYPPLLEAEGLASAIAAQARRAPIPVTVDSDGIGRYPREIESTVYFCVLEALRNTVQHAGASQATVTLTQSNGALEFLVTDDGAGFDPDTARGVGLTAMADRLDALTGELQIHTEPGNGTTLTGTIPVPVEVPA